MKPTLINPRADKIQKTVAIFRDGEDGKSTSRTVYYCTPEEARKILDDAIQAIGNGKAETQ